MSKLLKIVRKREQERDCGVGASHARRLMQFTIWLYFHLRDPVTSLMLMQTQLVLSFDNYSFSLEDPPHPVPKNNEVSNTNQKWQIEHNKHWPTTPTT